MVNKLITYNKNKLFRHAAITLLSFIFLLCFAVAFVTISVSSEEPSITPSLFLPSSPIETNSLVNPKDAIYLPDGRIATVQGNNKKVVIYSDEASATVLDFNEISQIKYLNNDYIVIADESKLSKISTADYGISNYSLVDSAESVQGKYFDLNGNYFIKTINSILRIYRIEENALEEIVDKKIDDMNGSASIAINETGDIFYFMKDNHLYKRNIESFNNIIDMGVKLPKTNIIADDSFVYYIGSDNTVYRINIKDDSEQQLAVKSSDDFDLGKLVSPTSLSFKGDNLLITDDSIGAVQEFRVEGDKLVFTGFAIASGKTAFNRIGNTASEVSVANNSLAVLDDYKLTVIKDLSSDLYSQDNYFNLVHSEKPDFISVGNGTVLLAKDNKTEIYSLSGEKLFTPDFDENNNITDVCYIDGFYYIVMPNTGNTNHSVVFRISEIDGTAENIFVAENHFGADTFISVDIYGNVILCKDGNIYTSANGFSERINNTQIANIKKIQTDLNGNVFAFTGNAVYYIAEGQVKNIPLSDTFKSFALSFDSKRVYFIKENDERIYSTDELLNLSITDITVPDSFKTSGESADKNNFKTFSLNDGAVSFVISTDNTDKFKYEKTGSGSINEYILICETEYKTAEDLEINLSILLGYDELRKPIFLAVKSDFISEITSVSDKEEKRYISTDVNVYYLPMITENDDFCIKDGDGILRLSAKTEINVLGEVEFTNEEYNGKFFYIGLKNSRGEDVYGYVPEKFTVKVLSEDIKGETEISRIKSDNGNSFNKALIVIALAASVFGTSLFFILRKKG